MPGASQIKELAEGLKDYKVTSPLYRCTMTGWTCPVLTVNIFLQELEQEIKAFADVAAAEGHNALL